MTKTIRMTAELPDHEGRVFVTAVPDSPFHILGRRAGNGELYVSSLFTLPPGKQQPDFPDGMCPEIVTGQEAEELMAAVVISMNVCDGRMDATPNASPSTIQSAARQGFPITEIDALLCTMKERDPNVTTQRLCEAVEKMFPEVKTRIIGAAGTNEERIDFQLRD